ncbi:nuclear transport factor 2 family protein [Fulvivirga sp.]|uniref:nuclear transport factor 2 family protein n=1 Tax=Fulvivirga sp. TaxID=1931237 RepID=UPI0032EF677F
MIRTTLTLILTLTVGFSYSQKLSNEEQLKQVITKSFDEVWGIYNEDNIKKYYTDDFLLLENGEVWNNDSIVSYFNNVIKNKKQLHRVNDFTFIDVKVSGEIAWIAYQFNSVFTKDDKIARKSSYLESATAILTDDGWRLDMLHSTRTKHELFD